MRRMLLSWSTPSIFDSNWFTTVSCTAVPLVCSDVGGRGEGEGRRMGEGEGRRMGEGTSQRACMQAYILCVR